MFEGFARRAPYAGAAQGAGPHRAGDQRPRPGPGGARDAGPVVRQGRGAAAHPLPARQRAADRRPRRCTGGSARWCSRPSPGPGWPATPTRWSPPRRSTSRPGGPARSWTWPRRCSGSRWPRSAPPCSARAPAREAAARVGPALGTVLRAWEVALLPGVERLRETRLPGAVRTRAAHRRARRGRARASSRRPGAARTATTSCTPCWQPRTQLGVDDQQVRDEVMTLLLAGHETTANALTWTLSLLSDAPHVADRLRRELGRRRRRPAAVVRRPAAAAVRVRGGRRGDAALPAGVDPRAGGARGRRGRRASRCRRAPSVVMCTWVLHRDPRSWTAPRAFRAGPLARRRRPLRRDRARPAQGGLAAVRRRHPGVHRRVVRLDRGGAAAAACCCGRTRRGASPTRWSRPAPR